MQAGVKEDKYHAKRKKYDLTLTLLMVFLTLWVTFLQKENVQEKRVRSSQDASLCSPSNE